VTRSLSTGPALGSAQPIYPFDHDHGVPARELGGLLGGKGAGLAEMTAALGIAVPPGFTITLRVCRAYREGGWPVWLDDALAEALHTLEGGINRRFGDPSDPLLVAVRSGAPVSMPGMLDTVLNLGLNDDTVGGLARVSGDERFAWDSYRRFLKMFAITVMGIDADALGSSPADAGASELQHTVETLKLRITELSGQSVPGDPTEQLRAAVEAVFRSWDCDRAQAYRAKENIDASVGTAVNVQAMVFGNRGPSSGTGVVFTRDPATGAPGPYGDYLARAQGEDVVAGTARTMHITDLESQQPAAYAELITVLRRLELHYRDVCDVEFTIEDGKLWLLQTRVGKRGAVAAVRTAVDFVADPEIGLTRREALDRAPAELRERARQEILARALSAGHENQLLATGLGASPGRATGRVVMTSEEAADADDDVILARRETSPEDVSGMAASVGVLTTKGGLVSHAAVVARGWGIPAVVGAHDLTWSSEGLSAAGHEVRAGEVITIDGGTGQVWIGDVKRSGDESADTLVHQLLPELIELEQWAEVTPS
jgi:pyruvate,orthophosphate dikinase